MTRPFTAGPLSGLQVIELSSYIAAPLSGMFLPQLGAEVIRVEQLGAPPGRTGMPCAAIGTSPYWTVLNKGTKEIAINPARPEGQELVAAVVAAGDGVLLTEMRADGIL